MEEIIRSCVMLEPIALINELSKRQDYYIKSSRDTEELITNFDQANRCRKLIEALAYSDPTHRWERLRPLLDNDLANTVDAFTCAAEVFGISKEDQYEITDRSTPSRGSVLS